jgi:hypothetical protein
VATNVSNRPISLRYINVAWSRPEGGISSGPWWKCLRIPWGQWERAWIVRRGRAVGRPPHVTPEPTKPDRTGVIERFLSAVYTPSRAGGLR